jgi:hypothetical protein
LTGIGLFRIDAVALDTLSTMWINPSSKMPRTAGCLLLLLLGFAGGCARAAAVNRGVPEGEAPTTSTAGSRDESPDTAAALQTDRRVYRLERVIPPQQERPRPGVIALELVHDTVAIVVAYQNRSPHPVYLEYCGYDPGSYRLQKRVNGNWVEAYRPICQAVGIEDPFPVDPGEVFADTMTAHHFTGFPPVRPRLEVDSIPGTYRLIMVLYTRWHPNARDRLLDPQARQEVASNTFLILD